MLIRRAKFKDTPAIVAVHVAAFSGFFLTALGGRFLAELYRGFTTMENGVCFVACHNDEVVGFVAGAISPRVFFRRLAISRGMSFAYASVPALIRRPMYFSKKLLHGAVYRGGGFPEEAGAALLSSIGVHPDFGGKGCGSALIDAFCEHVKSAGINSVVLETDADGNTAINNLYVRNGFDSLASAVRRDGRRMNQYLRKL